MRSHSSPQPVPTPALREGEEVDRQHERDAHRHPVRARDRPEQLQAGLQAAGDAEVVRLDLVMPSERHSRSARASSRARSAGRDRDQAADERQGGLRSTPVGSPAGSRSITPPGGSGMSRETPARASAAELATAMWLQVRVR